MENKAEEYKTNEEITQEAEAPEKKPKKSFKELKFVQKRIEKHNDKDMERERKYASLKNMKLLRFLTLLLLIAIISVHINLGPLFSERRNVIKTANSFISDNVYASRLDDFRSELSSEEMDLDYDNDGVSNSDELSAGTGMFNNEKYIDVPDKKDIAEGKSIDDYKELFKNAFDVNSVEFFNHEDDLRADSFVDRYNGKAFAGLELLSKPVRIYNFTGSIFVKPKGIKDKLNKITSYNQSKSNNYTGIAAVSYSIEKDEYALLSNAIFDDIYNDYEIDIDVKNSDPIAIICLTGIETQRDIDFKYKLNERSLIYSELRNRKQVDQNFTVIKKSGSKGARYIIYNDSAENCYTLVSDENRKINSLIDNYNSKSVFRYYASVSPMLDMFNDINKVKDKNTKDMPFKNRFMSRIRLGSTSNYQITSQKMSWADMLDVLDGVKEIDALDEKADKSVIRKFKNIDENYKGYINSYNSGFSPGDDEFLFCNTKTKSVKSSIAVGMAETISCYANYGEIPDAEGVDTANILSSFDENKPSSDSFFEFLPYKGNKSVRTISDSELLTYLESCTQKTMESVYLTNEYHSNTEGVIKKVGEYLENNQTVVAYMRKGSDVAAVVVYAMKQDGADDNKYTLKVYDPNFPNSKIFIKNDKTGEESTVKMSGEITVYIRPKLVINSESQKFEIVRTFEFEYGETSSYAFGNSGYNKQSGIIFKDGDIAFKTPQNPSEAVASNMFITE